MLDRVSADDDVRDIFVSGLDHVVVMAGGVSRYVFYTEDCTEDGRVKRITLRLVMPDKSLPDAVMKSCSAASLAIMGTVLKPLH